MVIKGGEVAYANMGDPNASIPTPEPVMFSYALGYDPLPTGAKLF